MTSSTKIFWDNIKKISTVVDKWPEWKRNVLGTPLKRKEKEMKDVTDE